MLLVGPSGSGKSTLLMALAGLLDTSGGGESDGRLAIDGLDPRAARDRSALLLQDPEAQVVMGRVGDDVAFGLENRCVPADEIWPRVGAALDAVGLPHGRERSTDALSGGERQRLALAGTLAMRPALLLLDEPTASLDPAGAASFLATLREVLDLIGATLVMVEHRLDDALDVARRVMALDAGGRIMADGPALRVLSEQGDALEASGVWVPGRTPPPAPMRSAPSALPDTMLRADRVGFTYPGSARAALPPTDVAVRAGEALAVVGPTGAGKSTLAFLLGGLLRPTIGSVMAGERLAAGHGHQAIWRWPPRLLAGRIGSVFQQPEHQFLTGSVRDELRIGPRQLHMADADELGDALMERLSLAHLAAANPFTLSGGEQRRLSVGTALATLPAVLVIDEPTFGQDRGTWAALLALLAGLRDAGRALVVVSHDRDFVAALADRTLTLPAVG